MNDIKMPESLESAMHILGTTAVKFAQMTGGFSHLSWLVDCADNRRVVVRQGGSDATIEAAVLTLANEVVPTPRVIAAANDLTVLSFVEGQTLEHVLRTCKTEDLSKLANALGEFVARIGSVEFQRPGFFTTESLEVADEKPWSQQLTAFCTDQLASSDRFTAATTKAWIKLCEESAELLKPVDHFRRLVHSDMNPKNIIVRHQDNEWHVAAFIDWEFAYSGCPFADVGNFCRFNHDYSKKFLEAFVSGFENACPYLTKNWQRQARILDMFALTALAAKPRGHAVGDRAETIIQNWAARGIPLLVS